MPKPSSTNFTVHLVGNSHLSMAGKIAYADLRLDDEVLLIPEPENEFDSQAIRVETKQNTKIGYIARKQNSALSGLLNDGHEYTAIYTNQGKLAVTVYDSQG